MEVYIALLFLFFMRYKYKLLVNENKYFYCVFSKNCDYLSRGSCKKAEVTLETITFWQNICISIFKFSPFLSIKDHGQKLRGLL